QKDHGEIGRGSADCSQEAQEAVAEGPTRQSPDERLGQVDDHSRRQMFKYLQYAEPTISLKEANHPHDGAGRRGAPSGMGQASGQDIKREEQESLVPRREWQAGQQSQHLEGCQTQADAAHNGDIAGQLGAEIAIRPWAWLLAGEADVSTDGLDQ